MKPEEFVDAKENESQKVAQVLSCSGNWPNNQLPVLLPFAGTVVAKP